MTARCAAWLVFLFGLVARAEPTVVLVETREAPALPALAAQIELHAGRRVVVQTLDATDADPMTFGERAAQLVAAGRATIVVWIAPLERRSREDQDRGGREVPARELLVFVAGGWPGRALVELVRVDAALGGAEIERTVALKIAGLLDAILAPRASAQAVLGIGARPVTEWRLEIAGLLAVEPHQRGIDGRIAVAGTRAWAVGAWRMAPLLAGYWQPSGAIDGERGRASLTEIGGAIAVEASWRAGGIELLARPRFVLGIVAADGVASDGRRGTATVLAPYAGLEAGVRRAVSDSLQIGLVAGSEIALRHHRLQIDRETVVDLGRFRLHVGVLLTMSL